MARQSVGEARRGADPVLAAASALWPDPSTVRLVRDRRRPGTARDFLLLPSARRPRVVLPAGESRAAATIARRQDGGSSPFTGAGRLGLAVAARLGVLDAISRDRLRVEAGPGDTIERELAALLGRPIVIGIGVGTARANRKPVLHVLDGRGTTLAFVKVGDTDSSRALVDREAAALERLRATPLEVVRAPEVLHHTTWQGLRLLVLAPLLGGRRRRRGVPLAAMAEVARAGGSTVTTPLRTSPFWHRVRAEADAIDPTPTADRLRRVLSSIDDRLGDTAVEVGRGHGDWTPWNMAWRADGVDVWDWERYEEHSPVGADAVHYCYQRALRRSGSPDRAVAELDRDAAALLAELGVPTAASDVVVLHLAALAARYVGDAHGPLGAHIAGSADFVLRELERRLGCP